LGKDSSESSKWVGQGYSNSEWVESEGGFLDHNWEKDVPDYFGGVGTANGEQFIGWSGFAYGNMDQFRRENLVEMTNEWLIDSVKGFNHPLCNPTFGAIEDYDNWPDVFASAPDIAWYAYRPLFKHHICEEGNYLTLKHLKQYNMEWGMPVAPEARKKTPWPDLWGDQYSNFNAGKIDLLIEGIGGLNYSFADSTFTFADHLPKEWGFMEWRVPVKHYNWSEPKWVTARAEKTVEDGKVIKRSSVSGNPLKNLIIEPWHEGREVSATVPENLISNGENHFEALFTDSESGEVILEIKDTTDIVVPISRVPQEQFESTQFYPNPVSISDNIISIDLPQKKSSNWEVMVFDAVGNVIDEKQVKRPNSIYSWNLKNKRGVTVAPGIYLAIFKAEDEDGSVYGFKRLIGVKQ
jgi:hypothetical protein